MYKIKMLPFVYDTCMCAYHTCACVYDVAGRVEEENPPPHQPNKYNTLGHM